MDIEELERERAVLLPERIAMRRHERRRRRNLPVGPVYDQEPGVCAGPWVSCGSYDPFNLNGS
jgi:hypothetical protein